MTAVDVVGQVGEIRARLAQLLSSQTTTADSGASFADALSGATTTDGTTAASGTASTSAIGATGTGTGVTGDDVVQAALQYKGVPYVLGGESKSGIDCSGLVQSAFKDLGVSVPRLVHEQQTIGTKVDSLKDAKPGDLIVLNGGDHVAIWMGNDTVIHAPYPGRTVSVQKAWFKDSDVTAIRRVVPATDDATATTAAPSASTSAGTTSALGADTAVASTGATPAVSAATTAQAAAMMAMFGASDSSSTSSSSASLAGSTGSDSLSALLASIGATSSGTTTSGTTAQQLLSARAALLGTGA